MKIGLVGLNQTGKTTIFDLLTHRDPHTHALESKTAAKAAASTGVGFVPDARLDFLSGLYLPKKTTNAQIELTDVTGFSISGEGQKSGAAKFLNDVRHCDALLHVLRAFDSDSLPHEQGEINPARDLKTVETELLFADLELVDKRIERITTGKKITKEHALELEWLKTCYAHLESGGSLADVEQPPAELNIFGKYQFLTTKPRLAVVNLDENQLKSKTYPYKDELEASCAQLGMPLLELCGDMELEVSRLPEGDKSLFMEDLGISQPGISVLAKAMYDLLGYISFFTVGEDEVKAWTVTDGIHARAAAGKIHSDIERGFIRAEVVKFADIKELGSMAKVKEKGLFRLEGKEYPVVDGDIIHYRFNV